MGNLFDPFLSFTPSELQVWFEIKADIYLYNNNDYVLKAKPRKGEGPTVYRCLNTFIF